mmetsp:Transcript_22108/g.33168  ORF Transcript_22108/g.33168 Transcript_22108/m.33168 type:complete len:231 (-) Transcript_22108:1176-1868(-)
MIVSNSSRSAWALVIKNFSLVLNSIAAAFCASSPFSFSSLSWVVNTEIFSLSNSASSCSFSFDISLAFNFVSVISKLFFVAKNCCLKLSLSRLESSRSSPNCSTASCVCLATKFLSALFSFLSRVISSATAGLSSLTPSPNPRISFPRSFFVSSFSIFCNSSASFLRNCETCWSSWFNDDKCSDWSLSFCSSSDTSVNFTSAAVARALYVSNCLRRGAREDNSFSRSITC